MTDKLPNELIREILWPALYVPDETFCDISEVSPFFRPSQPTSSLVLQVCKRWMLVGTPLLYHTVILRSKAQANSLEHTLRAHKKLGASIKQLRIEGAYGSAVRIILTSSPNVQDLCLSLDIYSCDNTKCLANYLSYINPTRLVVCYIRDGENASMNQVVAALCSGITSWTNLVSSCDANSRTDR
jgi:hypothetical protein